MPRAKQIDATPRQFTIRPSAFTVDVPHEYLTIRSRNYPKEVVTPEQARAFLRDVSGHGPPTGGGRRVICDRVTGLPLGEYWQSSRRASTTTTLDQSDRACDVYGFSTSSSNNPRWVINRDDVDDDRLELRLLDEEERRRRRELLDERESKQRDPSSVHADQTGLAAFHAVETDDTDDDVVETVADPCAYGEIRSCDCCRCPGCGIKSIRARKTMTPTYACDGCDETFDEPVSPS